MTLKTWLMFCILVIVVPSNAARVFYGLGSGIGAAVLFGDAAILSRYDLHVQVNRFHAQVRLVGIDCGSSPEGVASPAQQHMEAGLMAGALFPINKYLNYGFSGGLSFVYSTKRVNPRSVTVNGEYTVEYSVRQYRTVGVPLQAEIEFLPSRIVGIGAQLIANVNGESPNAGLSVSVKLGRLR